MAQPSADLPLFWPENGSMVHELNKHEKMAIFRHCTYLTIHVHRVYMYLVHDQSMSYTRCQQTMCGELQGKNTYQNRSISQYRLHYYIHLLLKCCVVLSGDNPFHPSISKRKVSFLVIQSFGSWIGMAFSRLP